MRKFDQRSAARSLLVGTLATPGNHPFILRSPRNWDSSTPFNAVPSLATDNRFWVLVLASIPRNVPLAAASYPPIKAYIRRPRGIISEVSARRERRLLECNGQIGNFEIVKTLIKQG